MFEREILIFLSALAAGVAVTAPPGPAGVLCVTRTLRGGLRDGLACGAGVALGDGVLGAVAALAVVSLAAPDPRLGRAIALVAAPVLAFLGARLVRRALRVLRGDDHAEAAPDGGVPSTDASDACATGRSDQNPATGSDPRRMARLLRAAAPLLLALSTPGTAPALAVLFTALGLARRLEPTAGDVALVALGVLTGGLLWWVVVLTLVDRFRRRALRYVGWMDATAGVALLAASLLAAHAALP